MTPRSTPASCRPMGARSPGTCAASTTRPTCWSWPTGKQRTRPTTHGPTQTGEQAMPSNSLHTPPDFDERVARAASVFMSYLPDNNRPTSDEDRHATREILKAAGFTAESVQEMRDEIPDECDALRMRMADLLTRTAHALKGEPEAHRCSHSWHDLPE